MGEAKRRRHDLEAQMATVLATAKQVGAAIEKLATASSPSLGSDCYMHASLSQIALRALGIEAKIEVGAASWRVGPSQDDSIGHHPNIQGYVPPGGVGLPFHAWLRHGDILIDTTTYQLRKKAAMLDAGVNDGITTVVTWCPPVLVEPVTNVWSFNAVVQADRPGRFFYQVIPQLQAVVEGHARDPDPQDVEALLLILRNPAMNVLGPNHLEAL